MPPLVTLDNVTLRFGACTVFCGLQFCVQSGEHLALIGPNGAGKSSLLRLLAGELHPPQTDETPGAVSWHFGGVTERSALSAREHARLVSPGQQRTYNRQGWRITGEEIILSGLDNASMLYGEVSSRRHAEAAELAQAAGASYLLPLTAPAMSQGQLRLTLLLRALVSRPALLLLDEPFDGLDAQARADIKAAIELAARRGSTVVITAHRRSDIPAFIESIRLLQDGKVLPVTKEAAFSRQISSPSPLPAFPQSAPTASLPPPAAVPCSSIPVLELSNVDVYIERTPVLSGINWRILPGEQWVVSGPNGSGKSTLLRLLYGEEFAAWGGEVRWFGAPQPALDELRSRVGFVSDRLQDSYDYDLTAEEVVISGLRGSVGLYHEPEEKERVLAGQWLDRMGLKGLEASPFFSLSSGTARRVLLARALASSPPVLLLDEPCSGLDPQSRKRFLDALPLLAAQGVSMVHVSHHPGDQNDLFTHELRLVQGRTVFSGPRR